MNVLPTDLMAAFTAVLDALRPLRFPEQRRVLCAAEIAIVDRASNADLARLQREAVRSPTILPSIHPDNWTLPPRLPPLPPPPSDDMIPTSKKPTKRRRKPK